MRLTLPRVETLRADLSCPVLEQEQDLGCSLDLMSSTSWGCPLFGITGLEARTQGEACPRVGMDW